MGEQFERQFNQIPLRKTKRQKIHKNRLINNNNNNGIINDDELYENDKIFESHFNTKALGSVPSTINITSTSATKRIKKQKPKEINPHNEDLLSYHQLLLDTHLKKKEDEKNVGINHHNNDDDLLVSEQNRPRVITDLIGNKKGINLLEQYMVQYEQQSKRPKRLPNFKSLAFINGPPGCGKTTAAQLILEKYKYTPYIMNASEDSGPSVFMDIVRKKAESSSSFIKHALIIDEIDGACDMENFNTLKEFHRYILHANEKGIRLNPIICIANELKLKNVRDISTAPYSLAVPFYRLYEKDLDKLLGKLMKKYSKRLLTFQRTNIVQSCNGDMRKLCNQFHFGILNNSNSGGISNNNGLLLGRNDETFNFFTFGKKILYGDPITNDKLTLYSREPNLSFLMIFENYPTYIRKNNESKNYNNEMKMMKDLSFLADTLSHFATLGMESDTSPMVHAVSCIRRPGSRYNTDHYYTPELPLKFPSRLISKTPDHIDIDKLDHFNLMLLHDDDKN